MGGKDLRVLRMTDFHGCDITFLKMNHKSLKSNISTNLSDMIFSNKIYFKELCALFVVCGCVCLCDMCKSTGS